LFYFNKGETVSFELDLCPFFVYHHLARYG